MLTKTHSIVTVDPFCNIFTFNFFYHSKSHSMTMNIWTFEKVVEYNINQAVTSKKSAYFGYMDPFLNVDTLYLTCIYSTFLFFSSCPEYLCTQKEKFTHLCHSLCIVMRRPLLTYTLFHFPSNTCLPGSFITTSSMIMIAQSTCDHLGQENNSNIEQIIGNCKLECRI